MHDVNPPRMLIAQGKPVEIDERARDGKMGVTW
jgi:hypothetical protein